MIVVVFAKQKNTDARARYTSQAVNETLPLQDELREAPFTCLNGLVDSVVAFCADGPKLDSRGRKFFFNLLFTLILGLN